MEKRCYCPSCMNEVTPGNKFCTVCGSSQSLENEIHQLPINTLLKGRYLTGKVLGEGGFGITYIGKDEMLDLTVAIKEYYPAEKANRVNTYQQNITVSASMVTDYQGGKEKFLSEARTLAIFSREPGVVCIRDFFEENNTAYIVMEYLDGSSLWTELNEKGPMSFDKVYGLLKPVMKSLQRVHDKGLVHRDISPANLMLLKDGSVKLLDFGTARNMNLGGEKSLSVIMKPGFAPEEQYDPHGEQGPWTDVYGLCATIYKLITNETPVNSMNRAFKDELVKPSEKGAFISPAQERVLLKGMAIKKKDRIQTMQELIDAFEKADEETIYSQRAMIRMEDETTLKGQEAAIAGGKAAEGQPVTQLILQHDHSQIPQSGPQFVSGMTPLSERGTVQQVNLGNVPQVNLRNVSQANYGTTTMSRTGNVEGRNKKLIPALIIGVIGLVLVIAALYFVPKWIDDGGNKKSSEVWGGVEEDDSKAEKERSDKEVKDESSESWESKAEDVPETVAESMASPESMESQATEAAPVTEEKPTTEVASEPTPEPEVQQPAAQEEAAPGVTGPTMIAELSTVSSGSPTNRGFIPTSVTASSEINNAEKNYDYRAIKAVDGDTTTCWQEDNITDGVGEWIRLDYDGEITVNSLVMFLGYGKAADGYYWNSRPCRLKVTFSDGNYVILNCLDVYGYQSVQLPAPVATSSLTIEIETTYPGEKWQDTSIAEIVVQ